MTVKSLRFPGCAILLGMALVLVGGAQEYLPDLSVNHPAIQYFNRPVRDPVTRLPGLEFGEDPQRNLSALLKQLGVNTDSQALVFSKTSFQSSKISPTNPRAIYFNDDVAIGFVRGSDSLEVAVTDPTQGVVLYTLNIKKPGQPEFHRSEVCLKCHQGPATSGVPGIFVGSVFANTAGTPSRVAAIITDHRTPFADRWGGWYVNATRGQQRDRANAVASNPADPEQLDLERLNQTHLMTKFNANGYLSPLSDIVALMTFEHQTQMTNYITRVGWEARIAAHDGKTDELTRKQIDHDIESMVDYMLFIDEVPLTEPLQGVSTFTQTFQQRGPKDKRGRSLRDFDLQKRLFRYPLSYVIYSEAFDGLPDAIRERVYRRLGEVLSGKDQSKRFTRLSPDDRKAILNILRETKPQFQKAIQ